MVGNQESYEEAFHEALKKAVRPGDVVWDVGANVGMYTRLFLDWTETSGEVVAFEPFPKAYESLRTAVRTHEEKSRLTVLEVALSNEPGQAVFSGNLDDEDVTTTAHIAENTSVSDRDIVVQVYTADGAVKKFGLAQPNVAKIDVEGFEEDVLKGGSETFGNPECRELLIEIHFARLEERKMGDSPARIVSMLKKWGYSVKWLDSAHVHASRN